MLCWVYLIKLGDFKVGSEEELKVTGMEKNAVGKTYSVGPDYIPVSSNHAERSAQLRKGRDKGHITVSSHASFVPDDAFATNEMILL